MDIIEQLECIKKMTAQVAEHLILNSPEHDSISTALIQHRKEIELMIAVLQYPVGVYNA